MSRQAINRPFGAGRDRWAWATALLITLIALFFQLYRLGDLWPVPRFDPAYNAMEVLRILRRGVTPIFFPDNGGREPLFIYMQAITIAGLGFNTFALRLPGALAGMLAVPALFGFSRSLLADEGRTLARWVPAWAALGLALSAWHVSQTRLGLRAALLPCLAVCVFWLAIIGWRRASLSCPHLPAPAAPRGPGWRRYRWLAAAGALLGVTLYTYTAARFLPFVLGLAFLPDLLAKPAGGAVSRGQRWLGFAVLALTALVVFAPLGWYYLHHPAMFADRAGSVMVWNVWKPSAGQTSTLVTELALNVWRVAAWFGGFPLLLVAGLVVGLGVALARIRRLEYRLLVAWWPVMLLPTLLTTEAPHLLRSLGAAPATYLLIGLGLAAGTAWLSRRWPVSPNLVMAAGLLVVAFSSFPLLDYFRPDQKDPLAGTAALADALQAETQTGVVYLPLATYADPRLHFLLAGRFEQRADWSAGTPPAPASLIRSADDTDLSTLVRLSPDGWATLLPPLSAEGQAALRKVAGGGQPIADRYGGVAGYKATVPTSADPTRYLAQAEFRAVAAVPGLADLAGYGLDAPADGGRFPHLRAGGPLVVNTFWQARGGATEDYRLIVYLIDDAGRRWGETGGPPLAGAYPTSMWRPGEKVADRQFMWVYPEAPAGRYWLALAFYDYARDARLPVTGGFAPDTIRLGPLKIPMPAVTKMPADVQAQSARFGDVARLLGYRLASQPDRFTLSLYWQAEKPDDIDYTVFVHLLNAAGQMVAGQDSQPVGGRYPTSIWEPGEIVPDERSFATGDLPPGTYQLEVGMYVVATGERLSVALPDGTTEPARRLVLTTPVQVP
jgi:4-amino-4-deoxy-L-arabinose transferase-like glycosyltransferase